MLHPRWRPSDGAGLLPERFTVSEVSQRIARAIAVEHYRISLRLPADDPAVIRNADANWRIWEHEASIALTAMDPATDAMVTAGAAVASVGDPKTIATNVFKAMIAEAAK